MSNSNATTETRANTLQARTCYIAAPLNTHLKALEKLLMERQIQPVVSADLSAEAVTLLDGIEKAISSAELFIAILNEERNNASVYFELGIAHGLGCRILIIAPPDRPLMVDIAELPVVRADITNREAIGLMLDQVLQSPPRKFRSQLPTPLIQEGHPIGDHADGFQAQLTALVERGREVEIIQLVKEAIEKSGYTTIATNPFLGFGKRADIVVWSEEFGPWIGNPLIIEVKKGVREREWKSVVDQVSDYLRVSQTRSALILYAQATDVPGISPSIAPPNIFSLDIQQLLSAMRTKSFARVLIDLRNRRVHGVDTP